MGSYQKAAEAFEIKTVCIIGAGPTGLAVAKQLLAEKVFERIAILEQQAEVGGVWNYTPPPSEHVEVPQTKPQKVPDTPIYSEKFSGIPIFSNPMYEVLNTNIPKNLMQYSDLDFPKDSLLFPTRQDVQEYLLQYAEEVRHLIQFSTQVEKVLHFVAGRRDKWKVVSSSLLTKEEKEDDYDAVVVASGHYSVAYIPEVAGIESFNARFPSIISHSKTYRSPETFRGKKVIVVGSGPSGLDIGTQISRVSQKPLLNSVRTPSTAQFGQEDKEEVDTIIEYVSETRGVRFESGRVENGIDAVIYCTGYLYSYPFLSTLQPPVVTDGSRARGLYQQLFSIAYPSIAFTALSQRIIPFPLSEVQGAAIAKVWANNLTLPNTEEMLEQERQQVEKLGDGKSFHFLPYPKDANYIKELYNWTSSARGGFAKEPPCWGPKECWIRENFGAMRKAFVERGKNATSMEELGFSFEPI